MQRGERTKRGCIILLVLARQWGGAGQGLYSLFCDHQLEHAPQKKTALHTASKAYQVHTSSERDVVTVWAREEDRYPEPWCVRVSTTHNGECQSLSRGSTPKRWATVGTPGNGAAKNVQESIGDQACDQCDLLAHCNHFPASKEWFAIIRVQRSGSTVGGPTSGWASLCLIFLSTRWYLRPDNLNGECWFVLSAEAICAAGGSLQKLRCVLRYS